LVSTDVDKLIRTVAEKKRVGLYELQQICRIDKKNMDKWIRVLEDEGYITIEYGIRGTYVIWSGRGGIHEAMPQQQAVNRPEAVVYAQEAQKRPQMPEEDNEPEELLSKYLERKRTQAKGEDTPDSIKSSILSSMKDEKRSERKSELDGKAAETGKNISDDVAEAFAKNNLRSAKRQGNEISNTSLGAIPTDVYETVSASSATDSSTSGPGTDPESSGSHQGRSAGKEEAKTVFSTKNLAIELPSRQRQVVSTENREMVNAYMDEINREKGEIEQLKKEKETLYREKLLPIESKMESDIVAFTERIMDKHAKITQLQEKVLEFPQKVGELERAHAEVSKVMEEGKSTLERTSKKLDEVMNELRFSKGEVEDKISEIRSTIESETKRIDDIDRVRSAADERLDKLNGAISLVKSQMDELHSTMEELEADWSLVAKTKTELSGMVLSVKGTISDHNEELQSLESELEELSKVEGWFGEYIDDYEKKIADLEQYVVRSDEDLTELQESAESAYMKNYLKELESITDNYQKELDGALDEEKDIESKISSSKEKVSTLIRESHDMMRNMREGTPVTKDFDTLRKSLKERAAAMKGTLAEKAKERDKLKEDSGKARKTRGFKGKESAKAAAKPAAKPAAKSAPKSVVKSVAKTISKSVPKSAGSKKSAKKGKRR